MDKAVPDIQIFNQSELSIPINQEDCLAVTQQLESTEGCSYRFIEVVYVDEEEIVRINKEHLNRDYVTDIITFRYDDSELCQEIEGTMFCCAPRIKEQAQEFNESIEREFLRIVIHGLLHLAGYEDQSTEEKQKMTEKEDYYLAEAEKLK